MPGSEVDGGSGTPSPLVAQGQSRPLVGPASTGPPRPTARRPTLLAAGLLGLSAALHIVMIWPAQGHLIVAFDDHAYLVVQQVVLAVGWLTAAGLAARGRPGSVTAGAALAAGIALAELGIVVSNLAEVLAESTAGTGAWLFLAAWVVGLVGAVVAVAGAGSAGPGASAVLGQPGWLVGPDRVVAVAGGVAAVVVGVALLPAWDHYVITSSVLHRTIATQSLGSAFAAGTPGVVMSGDLLTAVAFALVPLIALWWRPGRVGALLTGGVLVVVGAELTSAVVGVGSSPADFGLTAVQVRTYGVRVHSSLTAAFVVELVAGVALLLLVLARWWQAGNGSTAAAPPVGTGPLSASAFDTGRWPRPEGNDRTVGGGWGPPVQPHPNPRSSGRSQ